MSDFWVFYESERCHERVGHGRVRISDKALQRIARVTLRARDNVARREEQVFLLSGHCFIVVALRECNLSTVD